MPSITSFKVGDIVSVNFPYSDLQGYKRRPGLVLHFDQQDLLLARITTQPASTPTDISITQWTTSGLPRPSTIKLAKLASIDQRLIHKIVGPPHCLKEKFSLHQQSTSWFGKSSGTSKAVATSMCAIFLACSNSPPSRSISPSLKKSSPAETSSPLFTK